MTNVDQKILDTITEIRRQHNACTARAVAAQLRMSADMIRYRVDQMRKAGLVTWTEVPGSLTRNDNALKDTKFVAAMLRLSHIPEVADAISTIYGISTEPTSPGPEGTTRVQTLEQAAEQMAAPHQNDTEPDSTPTVPAKPQQKTPRKRAPKQQ